MKTLTAMFEQLGLGEHFFKDYSKYIAQLLADLDLATVDRVAKCFLQARRKGNTIFFAGNGGSAATASHFAQDVGEIGRKVNKPGFKTLSLAEHVAQITAISNDYGYEHAFSIQLKELFRSGDVLVVISASGNSPNVINAVEAAKKAGGITIGLLGFDGGKLAQLCDQVIHVKTVKGEYGPVEDVHLMLDHMISSYLTLFLEKETKPQG